MSDSIFYAVGKRQHGPVSVADLRALAAKGKFERTDNVGREGMAEWRSRSGRSNGADTP